MNAKKIARLGALAPILLVVLSSTAMAQTNVVLIDIGQVFKNHPVFSEQLAGLKSQADAFKAEAQNAQVSMMKRAEQLQFYQKESQEYRDLESQLAKESAELEVQQRAKMRELLSAEARLHYDTYQEVRNVISQYCQEQGIQLVLRYNAQEMTPDNPASIMQRVNGGVVYARQGKDITPIIIQRITQMRTAQSPSATTNR